MNRARYAIIDDRPGEPLVIKDLGPWDQHPTVTNDVENIVTELVKAGKLPEGRRLFYIDSEGRQDEILHKAGCFLGFAPGRIAESW